MLDTKRKFEFYIICPKCKKPGFLNIRWVQSSYYPKITSLQTIPIEEFKKDNDMTHPVNIMAVEKIKKKEGVSGDKYRGKSDLDVYGHQEGWNDKDKSLYYKVKSKKYYRMYVVHYDKVKYYEQLQQYKQGLRKSRPTGKSSCLIPKKLYKIQIMSKKDLIIKTYDLDVLKEFLSKRNRKRLKKSI